jgi:hypothetical protein
MISDALQELNPDGFARQDRTAALEAEIATLASQIHAATYRLIEMLGEFDELGGWSGWPTPAHWLQWRCGFSLNAGREKFRVARALPELPHVREAFRKGRLSFAHVRAITRIATPQNEATVLMWARHSTASHMEKIARLYRRHGEHAAALAQHRERSFRWWEEDDGMVSFRVRLPAEQAAVVLKAIEAAKASLDGKDAENEVSAEALPDPWQDLPEHPDEDVSAETRRTRKADALVRLAEAYLEPDLRPRALAEKYQVHVHLDLRKDARAPVYDPDAPALAAETVRRLACDANLVPVGREGDEILSVGRKTRAVPPAIRRALRLRDKGCRFPGCTHTRHVDAHHIKHWADGGQTKLSNLVELCGRHHRLLHEGGYGLKAADDGALVFTRPDGERIPESPRSVAVLGDPIAVLASAHHELHVSAETFCCRWDGARPDYGAAIEVLDALGRTSRAPVGGVSAETLHRVSARNGAGSEDPAPKIEPTVEALT